MRRAGHYIPTSRKYGFSKKAHESTPPLTARTRASTNPARTAGPHTTYPPDGAGWWDQGRSVLFPGASVYVANGKFWRQDAAGNTTGPY